MKLSDIMPDDVTKIVEALNNRLTIANSQIERLYNSGRFTELVEKCIAKYSSNEYRNKWYNLGIEPPESLYFFLYEYAERYGNLCNETEWATHGNTFTKSLYYCNGYYFNLMLGQGCKVKIIKK